jgi:large subunit ribosomal protein L6
MPIPVPQGTKVELRDGLFVAEGPKGRVEQTLFEGYPVEVKDGVIEVQRTGEGGTERSRHGLLRALLANAVQGVSAGFTKQLDIVGVGYRAEVKGQDLTLALGLSHPVNYTMPKSVSARVETIDEGGIKRPRLHLTSYDKEALGQTAARIRSFRKPEPYKGKGVRYTGEKLREKAGKAGGKK